MLLCSTSAQHDLKLFFIKIIVINKISLKIKFFILKIIMYRENLIIVVLKCIYASWKGWETLVQSIYSKSSRGLKLKIIYYNWRIKITRWRYTIKNSIWDRRQCKKLIWYAHRPLSMCLRFNTRRGKRATLARD